MLQGNLSGSAARQGYSADGG
uniref:Putative mechanosensitive ion channel protein n=1 Tax=mine drainage metagenome TaxID=410659 RepID=E6QD10_9ZZZZ